MNIFLSRCSHNIIKTSFLRKTMFYSKLANVLWKTDNHKNNRLYQRALKIVYYDYVSSFQDLLIKDILFTIKHHKMLGQSLATKISRTLNNLPGGVFIGLFILKTQLFSPFRTRINYSRSKQSCKGKLTYVFWCHYMEIQFQVVSETLNYAANFILNLRDQCHSANGDYTKTMYKS